MHRWFSAPGRCRFPRHRGTDTQVCRSFRGFSHWRASAHRNGASWRGIAFLQVRFRLRTSTSGACDPASPEVIMRFVAQRPCREVPTSSYVPVRSRPSRWMSWSRLLMPRPATLADMQTLLDTFRDLYNNDRPHRALPAGTTPAQAYTALPKAAPPGCPPASTSASATTPSTNSANSPCATPAACATSASAAPTPAPKSSSLSPPSPSSAKPTTASSAATASNPTATTGATKTKTPADGRGICNR
jgi:hypothetical protein